MRLLITNTSCLQAYAITRCLRPYAETIVATTSGRRPLGFWPNCHAAYSRLVDRRYPVPDPEADWAAGRIQPENTADEQAFVDAVLAICARESIDAIFPSIDHWVYVLAKNRALFAARGITIPVPDYATVIKSVDKYRTVQAAIEAGFPVPRTYLPADEADLRRIAGELAPPWVIKPRFTRGGRGLAVVDSLPALLDRSRAITRARGTPMIQQYIPGLDVQSFYLVLGRDGAVHSALAPKVLRNLGRIYRSGAAAVETTAGHPFLERAIALARHIGWWGGTTLQTKIDPRDGEPKLMEMNPRLGTHLWYRTELGVNEPLMCLQIARGEPVVAPPAVPPGCAMLSPVEDALSLLPELVDLLVYRLRTDVLGHRSIDPLSAPSSLRQRFGAYRAEYLGRHARRFHPLFRYALTDPLPTLIWYSMRIAPFLRFSTRGVGS